jgi:integrase
VFAAGTLRRELAVLRAAVNSAARANHLTHPVSVWLPDAPEPLDVWLIRGEVARLLDAARSLPLARRHLPLAILLAVYTGRRKEAVSSLRWHQIDLVRGTIDFPASCSVIFVGPKVARKPETSTS